MPLLTRPRSLLLVDSTQSCSTGLPKTRARLLMANYSPSDLPPSTPPTLVVLFLPSLVTKTCAFILETCIILSSDIWICSIFCASNCTKTMTGYSGSPIDAVTTFFPSSPNFTATVVPKTGHGLNVHLSAPSTYDIIGNWTKTLS